MPEGILCERRRLVFGLVIFEELIRCNGLPSRTSTGKPPIVSGNRSSGGRSSVLWSTVTTQSCS